MCACFVDVVLHCVCPCTSFSGSDAEAEEADAVTKAGTVLVKAVILRSQTRWGTTSGLVISISSTVKADPDFFPGRFLKARGINGAGTGNDPMNGLRMRLLLRFSAEESNGG
jgi:hypothetical protein